MADHPELPLRLVQHLPHLVTDQDAIPPALVWNALERELPVIDEVIGRLLRRVSVRITAADGVR